MRTALWDISGTGVGDFDIKEFTDIPSLSSSLSKPPKQSRLLVVEDLSTNMIELLGRHFDVNPAFFSSHICAIDWFSRAASPTTVPFSKSEAREHTFFQLRYLEARPVKSQHQSQSRIQRPACFDSNLLRKLSIMKVACAKNLIGFARRQVSIWMEPLDNGGWNGIILVDPEVKLHPITGLEWDRHARPEVVPPLAFSSDLEPPSQPSRSMYDDILNYYRRDMASGYIAPAAEDRFHATNAVLRTVAAEWLNVSHIVGCELMAIDFDKEVPKKPSFLSLQHELLALHMWRRRCRKYGEMLEQMGATCKERSAESGGKDMSKTVDLASDFHALAQNFESLTDQADKLTTVVVGRISVETGRQSAMEAHRITRLTAAALVFLPLAFFASFFSMSGEFAADQGRWWMFWVLAIPVTCSVTYWGLAKKSEEVWTHEDPWDRLDSTMLMSKGASY
jgi:hypothetical protein